MRKYHCSGKYIQLYIVNGLPLTDCSGIRSNEYTFNMTLIRENAADAIYAMHQQYTRLARFTRQRSEDDNEVLQSILTEITVIDRGLI